MNAGLNPAGGWRKWQEPASQVRAR